MVTEERSFRASIEGDIRALTAELAKIPGVTEKEAKAAAQKMSNEFLRAQKVTAAAAQRVGRQQVAEAAANAKAAETALKSAGQGAARSKEALAELGSALNLIDPRLGAVASGAGAVTGGFKAVTAAGVTLAGPLAIIAVALAAGALAWRQYSKELEEAEEKQRRAADAAQRATEIFQRQNSNEELARLRAAVAIGEEHQDVLDGRLAQEQAVRDRAEGRRIVEERLTEQVKRLADAERELAELRGGRAIGRQVELQNQIQTLNGLVKQGHEQVKAYDRETDALAGTYVEASIGARQHAEAVKKGEEAQRKAEEAARKYAAELKSVQAAIADVTTQANRADADSTILFDAEQEIAKLDELIAEAERYGLETEALYRRQVQVADEASAAIVAQVEEQAEAQRSIWSDYYDWQAEVQKENAEKAEEEAEKRLQEQENIRIAALDTAAAVAASIQTFTGEAIAQEQEAIEAIRERAAANGRLTKQQQERIDDLNKKIRRQFAAQQVAAVGEIAMNTAVAVMQALAQLGPVAGAIAAGGIVATGATQAAVVANQRAPTAHTGMAPDEMMTRVKRNEAVLNTQGADAVGGSDGVRRLNRGDGGGRSQPLVVQQVYDHRSLNSVMVDHVGRGGSLTRAIKQGRRAGQIRRNR